MKVKLKNLKPNPFRNIKQYPIKEEKVKQLMTSIRETGFWENILCRKRGDNVEIAYGHHRLEALRQVFGPDKEISVIVKDLDNETMIRVMANENDERYNCIPAVIDETVKSARDYLKEHPEVARKVLSSEPSEVKRIRIGAPIIAKFLGENWTITRVEEALSRLNMIEDGIVSSEALYEFPTVASAMNFARAVKEGKVKLNKQETIAKEISKHKTFGRRSMELAIWDFSRFKDKIQPKEDHVDFADYQLKRSTALIKQTINSLSKFEHGVTMRKSGLIDRGLLREDISPDTIDKYNKIMFKLAAKVKKVSDIISNLPSEENR